MEKYHIKLTESEAAILAKIDIKEPHRNHDEGHAAYKANAQPILALLQSLSDRSAIPQQRMNYWNDPRYHQGRIKASRKGLFETNGCRGADIYTHPHFIRHLRYFLFGAELPDEITLASEKKVGNPQWVTSSDIVPIAHCLIKNVTGELTVRSGAAIPNRIGVADGRTDQHGCAARDHGGGGRPLSISRAGR